MRLVDQCFAMLREDELSRVAPTSAIRPTPPSEPEKPFTPTRVSSEGIALIKSFEGFGRKRPDGKVEAYPDPASQRAQTGHGSGAPWTIGWGSTGAGIDEGTIWTVEQCSLQFNKHIKRFAQEVTDALGSAIHSTSQPQFDALVSFHYNTGALKRSTLLRKHKAGDYKGAKKEFGKWVYANGHKLRGLVRRRKAEAALYGKGIA